MELLFAREYDLRKDYEKIIESVNCLSRFTYQSFCNARLLVSSRLFGLTIHTVRTDALIPMADLLNHGEGQTSWFFSE